MSEFIQTDDYQWQRKVGDVYEMYQIVDMAVDKCPYFAGGGTFEISDFDQDDIDHALRIYGYMTMENLNEEYGDASESILAEILFECNWADWDLESFDTEEEALEFVYKKMGE